MKKAILLANLLCAVSWSLFAQHTYNYSLQECIDSAIRRNIPLRNARLTSEAADLNVNQARSAALPVIYGNVGQGFNTGRTIDPFTNDYVNRNINYGSYGITGDVTLFNGFSIKNKIRESAMIADASRLDVAQTKQDVILRVTLAYLRVLNTEEQLQMVKTQAELSKKQLDRLELRQKKGVNALSQVTDLRGQLLNDQLLIVDLANTLEWYKMELAQEMNVPYKKEIGVKPVVVEKPTNPFITSTEAAFSTSLREMPYIRAAELRTKSAVYGLKAARGLRYQTLFVGSNFGTVYTSSARLPDGKIGFGDQFRNNYSGTALIGLRIPIFTGNAIMNNIKLSEINQKRAELNEETVKTTVWRELEAAYRAMTNAYIRYETLQNQLEAYRVSYTAAEARFETGVDNTFNYLNAKNNLDRANINFINAKYEFLLRKKVMEYYQQNEFNSGK